MSQEKIIRNGEDQTDEDFKIGEEAEKEFARLIRKVGMPVYPVAGCEMREWPTYIKKVDWKEFGYDLEVTTDAGKTYKVEVKSNAGEELRAGHEKFGQPYDTFTIEAYSKKGERPHWWDEADIIVMNNRLTKDFYAYDAEEAQKTIDEKYCQGGYFMAKNGSYDKGGQIVKFPWRGYTNTFVESERCFKSYGYVKNRRTTMGGYLGNVR
jgi:hypothetical protein